MPIHREGYSTLTGVAAALFIINSAAFFVLPRSGLLIVLSLSLVMMALVAQFFRNPARRIPASASGVIAPADGTIVALETVEEREYFGEERLKLSIYMSAFNVHLNRVPLDGRVVYQRYHPGQYLVAFHPKASELNERNSIVVERADGQRVMVRQIAGILARRIRCYVQDGQAVRGGEELGFIKFGSRCDVFLPKQAEIRVMMGQKVSGGETILAEINVESERAAQAKVQLSENLTL